MAGESDVVLTIPRDQFLAMRDTIKGLLTAMDAAEMSVRSDEKMLDSGISGVSAAAAPLPEDPLAGLGADLDALSTGGR